MKLFLFTAMKDKTVQQCVGGRPRKPHRKIDVSAQVMNRKYARETGRLRVPISQTGK